MKTYDVLPLFLNDGKRLYFACEIIESESVRVNTIGIGCEDPKNAWTILDSFLED